MTVTISESNPKLSVADAPGTGSPLAKFQGLQAAMNASLLERQEEVNALLVALICGEHCVFTGPPGTAKSMMINSLVHGIIGARKFPVLLTKFTMPEEVFGPVSIKALKDENKFERITAGCLPDCEIAFLDEVFKASSAILNACLTAMEERRYKNAGQWHSIPLMTLVGASNEWPIGDNYQEMGALFDRFLFRLQVRPVSRGSRDKLLFGNLPPVHAMLDIQDVKDAQIMAEAIPWSDAAKQSLMTILTELDGRGIRPGDRRLRKSVGACCAQAFLNGNSEVQPEDLTCLKHTLWEHPADHMMAVAEVIAKISDPAAAAFGQLIQQIDELMNKPEVKKQEPGAEFFGSVKKLKKINDELKVMATNATGNHKARVETAIADLSKQIQGLVSAISG